MFLTQHIHNLNESARSSFGTSSLRQPFNVGASITNYKQKQQGRRGVRSRSTMLLNICNVRKNAIQAILLLLLQLGIYRLVFLRVKDGKLKTVIGEYGIWQYGALSCYWGKCQLYEPAIVIVLVKYLYLKYIVKLFLLRYNIIYIPLKSVRLNSNILTYIKASD